MLSRTVFFATFALLAAPTLRAQSGAPAFDVISVKLNANCRPGLGRAAISPRNLVLPCATLRSLIRMAYGDTLTGAGFGARRMEVDGGPGWLDTERYDILAKSESNGTTQSTVPLLQALLEARFQVKVHREARESPAYLLTLARDGSKMPLTREGSCTPFDLSNLQPPAPPKPGEPLPRFCGAGGERTKDGSLTVADWYGVTMAELAGRMLSGAVDHPVIDRTALTGRFDVHLEYVRDRQGSGPVMLNGSVTAELPAPPPDSAGPSIFAALEKQLGLKLSPGKAPLDVVLVDHAEKPTAN